MFCRICCAAARIARAKVERRVPIRPSGPLEPEQVTVELRDEVLALEAAPRVELRGVIRDRLDAPSAESLRLPTQAARAPVGERAVVLMATGEDGDVRVGREVRVEVALDEGVPLVAGRRPGPGARQRLRIARAQPGARAHSWEGEGEREGGDAASDHNPAYRGAAAWAAARRSLTGTTRPWIGTMRSTWSPSRSMFSTRFGAKIAGGGDATFGAGGLYTSASTSRRS